MQPILESLAMHLVGTQAKMHWEKPASFFPTGVPVCFCSDTWPDESQVEWSPRIYAINDFINEISLLRCMLIPWNSLFTLHDIYKIALNIPIPSMSSITGERSCSRILMNWINTWWMPNMLFSNIIDLKEMEEPLAGLEESQI